MVGLSSVKHFLKSVRNGLLIASVAAPLSNCDDPQPKIASAQTAPPTLTPGVSSPHDLGKVDTKGKDLPWYAAVQVTAVGPDPASAVSTITDPKRAQSVWKQVLNFFGSDPQVDTYSFVVQPIIGGFTLPVMTPIQISRNNTNGDNLAVSVSLGDSKGNGGTFSPWVPISSGSDAILNFTMTGSHTSNFSLFQDSLKFSQGVVAAGGWAVGSAITPLLSQVTSGLDQGFRNVEQKNTKAVEAITINIWKDQPRGYFFTLSDVDGKPFATVTVQLQFRQSLRNEISDTNTSSYQKVTGDVTDTPPFQTLAVAGTFTPVGNIITSNDALNSFFSTPPTNPQVFVAACKTLFKALTDDGFNAIDRTYIAYNLIDQSLAGNTIRSDPSFRSIFWRSCVPNRDIAEQIGLNVSLYDGNVPPNHDTINAVGLFVSKHGTDSSNPGLRPNAAALLASAIVWDGQPYTPDLALDRMAQLPNVANYHCNQDTNELTAMGVRQGALVFLRMSNQPDQVLALLQTEQAASNASASYVEMRSPTTTEVTLCNAQEKGRSGTPPKT